MFDIRPLELTESPGAKNWASDKEIFKNKQYLGVFLYYLWEGELVSTDVPYLILINIVLNFNYFVNGNKKKESG